MAIWLTSDWHLFHDKEFIYKARGFDNVEQMNEEIMFKHNCFVEPDDTVFVLGDVLLGGSDSLEPGLKLLSKFNGHKTLIRGNHDTDKRVKAFLENHIFESVYDALRIKYEKYHLYLSHYPTITSNFDEKLPQAVINLYGHTHQKDCFYYGLPFCYNVGVDSQECYPVLLKAAIADIKANIKSCKDSV